MGQIFANILFDDAFKVVVCAPGNEELLARIIELMVPGKTVTGLELREKENHGLSVSDKITNFEQKASMRLRGSCRLWGCL